VDYNGGAVLPAAINRYVQVAAVPAADGLHEVQALDLDETVRFSNASLMQKQDIHGTPLPAWARYPAGVAWAAHSKDSQAVVPLKLLFIPPSRLGRG